MWPEFTDTLTCPICCILKIISFNTIKWDRKEQNTETHDERLAALLSAQKQGALGGKHICLLLFQGQRLRIYSKYTCFHFKMDYNAVVIY